MTEEKGKFTEFSWRALLRGDYAPEGERPPIDVIGNINDLTEDEAKNVASALVQNRSDANKKRGGKGFLSRIFGG
jgi:hypothetical protein